MKTPLLLLVLALSGCTVSGAINPSTIEGKVEAVATAPLATCVGIVQQSNMLLQSLRTNQPPVLP